MDVIDGSWIAARLSGARGEQARLAEAIGISTDKLNKVLAGTRNVQASEIPKVLAFFADRQHPGGSLASDLDALDPALHDEVRRYIAYLKARGQNS